MDNKFYGKKTEYLPIREDRSRTIVSYGQESVSDTHCTWYEAYISKSENPSPSIEQIKDAVIADINRQTDEKILTGFRWAVLHGADEGKVATVWLSAENQANYKAFHDGVAYYPQVVTLPVTFKIGETSDGSPIYEIFQSKEELSTFYLKILAYIQHCLEEGWAEKDAIDWSEYERLLPSAEE